MKWYILLLGIIANASASVLVKMAMLPPRQFPTLKNPMATMTNWPFWGGLTFYGIAFLLYAIALARLPLNIAHPVLTAGAIAMVAILSSLIFKEVFYWNTIFGIIFITIGVALITYRTI